MRATAAKCARYVVVVPRAHDRMATESGEAPKVEVAAIRRDSRRREKLSGGIKGRVRGGGMIADWLGGGSSGLWSVLVARTVDGLEESGVKRGREVEGLEPTGDGVGCTGERAGKGVLLC